LKFTKKAGFVAICPTFGNIGAKNGPIYTMLLIDALGTSVAHFLRELPLSCAQLLRIPGLCA
jgi:hypothetical protein